MSSRIEVVLALVLLAGCSDADAGRCISGQTSACACVTGSTGAQTCGDDGRFGPCICEGQDHDVLVLDTSPSDTVATEVEPETQSEDDTGASETIEDAVATDAVEDSAATTSVSDVADTTTSDIADTTTSDVIHDQCQGVVISCVEGAVVAPPTNLHCTVAAANGVAEYQWSLRQPEGSAEVIRPSTTHRDIQFTATVVGTYVLVAEVTDSLGHECAPVEYEIVVSAGEGIFVELTWRTPGDENETDTGFTLGGASVGSDMDLHVLHANAEDYFDDVFDCYWLNKNPNWAGAGDSDDPAILRDDTDGGGPELFGLDVPQDATTYRIGAHYWDDWGFGNSQVSVRVFVRGALKAEWTDVTLKHHDMWDVFEVKWPSGDVTRIGGDVPSITHDYPIPL